MAVGGHARTHRVGEFLFDEGPHVSFTRDETVQRLLAKAVGDRFTENGAEIENYWKGHWVRHPVQTNLHGLPVTLVDRIIEEISAAGNGEHENPGNYAEWCEMALGKTFAREFSFPYTRKYWTTDAANMSTEWIGERIHRPALDDVVRGARSRTRSNHHYITRFRYPDAGGFEAYALGLAEGLEVRLGREVVSLNPVRRVLAFSDGTTSSYDALVSSLPLPALIAIIDEVPRSVKEAAAELCCTSIELVNVGFKGEIAELIPHGHWIYFYDEDIIFSRIHFPHRLSPGNCPTDCCSLQAEVYHSRYRPLQVDDVVGRVMDDLRRTKVLPDGTDVLFAEHVHVAYGNVLFDLKRERNVGLVKEFLTEAGIAICGRYGEWDYYWTDDSIQSGWRAAEHAIACSDKGIKR
jgi:protoporphyrinogen oxidase